MSINLDIPLKEVPGDRGLPVLGHTLEVLKDIQAFFDRKTKQHGGVFSTQFLGEQWIRLTGPDAVQFLLQDKDNHFSSAQGWASFVADLFPRGLMLKDDDEHLYHRRIMQVAFNKPAMTNYADLMVNLIPAIADRLHPGQKVDFSEYSRQVLLEIQSLVFNGETDAEQGDRLQKAFRDTVEATMAVVRKPIPFTKYQRGLKGRALLENYFLNKVPEKRAALGEDLFSKLCCATDEAGNGFTDREISDHMIFLLMAAQDTTSSALTTIFYALTEYPQWQEKLRAEYESIDELNYESLPKLELTSWVFKEALRMFTPGALIPRRAKHEVVYQGYRIPAGTIVSVSPIHSHFLPEYWTNPASFDPMRFSPERAEDKQHPFLFTPFSGGAHKCIGMHFAEMEIKIFLYSFLTKFKITRNTDKKVKWQKAPVWVAKNKMEVCFEPIE